MMYSFLFLNNYRFTEVEMYKKVLCGLPSAFLIVIPMLTFYTTIAQYQNLEIATDTNHRLHRPYSNFISYMRVLMHVGVGVGVVFMGM